ncbi:MAG TPA: 16S rRNA (cytosine(967)-C(5))-methyltransferase RsmB [Terriglobia bacterium]|nr:16S rRNA (cytosine(967)-C(5))-methyltransferase RsmB [Terriglobia bacterium]
MNISPARTAAFEILLRVESGRAFAVDLLQGESLAKLKEVDRNLATELVMGTLRGRGELDYWIERLSRKPMTYFEPEVAAALRLGIYQIRFLDRIPKAAAVNESVELVKQARKKSAAGLVNAVLRKCEPVKSAERAETEAAAALRSLPEWLRERWEINFGREAMQALALASLRQPPTALRVVEPGRREAVQARFNQEGIKSRLGKLGRAALVVETGGVQRSELVRERSIIIQDEASQLVAELVAPRPGQRVLDLCAAPGIKTGQLATAMGSGLLAACDVSARRLQTMSRLLPKELPEALHLERVRLDATQNLPFGCAFDRILVDAPCSGTGTLARNPELKWRLRPEDIARLAEVQSQILGHALECLAPAGRLVYATCSLEPEENEAVVESAVAGREGCRVLSAAEFSRDFPHLTALFDERGYFRTRPDRHAMDGFFAALLERLS